eukprot:2129921-Rhodomonas_salina.1
MCIRDRPTSPPSATSSVAALPPAAVFARAADVILRARAHSLLLRCRVYVSVAVAVAVAVAVSVSVAVS